MATHVVTALELNLRKTAGASGAKLAVLPQGTEITKIANASPAPWWEVDANIQGNVVRGFLNSRFVKPAGSTTFPDATGTAGAIPPADLGRSASAKRASDGNQAHAIGESGRPKAAAEHAGGTAAGIVAVIDWLNPGKSAHKRWWPAGGVTFCNVYVYDVCNIAGAYLPRVWWNEAALMKLAAGQTVEVKYGQTVDEMRANYIYNWLVTHGTAFGWERLFDADDLQQAANAGKIGIICAQRTQMNKPGHIQVIAPEHGSHEAKRIGGKVTQPLQSNAGSTNFTYGFLGSNWWQSASFKQFGFWASEP